MSQRFPIYMYKELWEKQIDAYLMGIFGKEYQNEKIDYTVTGHSMGAAVSQLVALKLGT
jgi:thioesterase domain-containing protein